MLESLGFFCWRRDGHMARQYDVYATQTQGAVYITIRFRLGLVNTAYIVPIFWKKNRKKNYQSLVSIYLLKDDTMHWYWNIHDNLCVLHIVMND